MRNVLNYIGAENDTNNSVYLALKGYLRKIRPTNKPKKTDGTKSPSQSERTFVSLAGYMTAVVHLISNTPDLVYSPSNPKLSISNLMVVRDQLTALNNDIAEKQSKLSQSISDRRDSFNTTIRLIPSIKRYLASYNGGKNNSKYIQFSNALNNG
jgi:hypothetical protein